MEINTDFYLPYSLLIEGRDLHTT